MYFSILNPDYTLHNFYVDVEKHHVRWEFRCDNGSSSGAAARRAWDKESCENQIQQKHFLSVHFSSTDVDDYSYIRTNRETDVQILPSTYVLPVINRYSIGNIRLL